MKEKNRKFLLWSLTFTKKVIILVTILWSLQLIYSAVMIYIAINGYGNFNYLDTFIIDNGESFRLIVGINIVSKTIENVFKYNEGGIFGTNVKMKDDQNVEKNNDNIAG